MCVCVFSHVSCGILVDDATHTVSLDLFSNDSPIETTRVNYLKTFFSKCD